MRMGFFGAVGETASRTGGPRVPGGSGGTAVTGRSAVTGRTAGISTAHLPGTGFSHGSKQISTKTNRKPVKSLRDSMRGRKLIMSVDRLDYSKGLVERFQAFERLLLNAPGWHGRVSLVQIAPPTRSDVQTYQRIRQNLEGEAGRINGRFAQLDWTPIQYLNRKYDRNLLMALFRLSQVGYVTPLRDGMNLVAKEYVASQDPADPGALVLSQFAGAADQLPGALVVNPFDLSQMSEALERALSMPLAERQARHADMMAPLRECNLSVWRDSFLRDLRSVATAASVTKKTVKQVAEVKQPAKVSS